VSDTGLIPDNGLRRSEASVAAEQPVDMSLVSPVSSVQSDEHPKDEPGSAGSSPCCRQPPYHFRPRGQRNCWLTDLDPV
jgi:hypothetical protein